MTAYVVNASGNANDSTKYTPNGLPTSVDTLTIGAFTLTIPSGYTLDVGAISMGASTFAARSKIIIKAGGTLKQNGTIAFTDYSEIRAEDAGVSLWDMNGFTTTFAAAGSVVRYSLTNDALGKLKITSTVGGTSTITSAGNLDIDGLEVIGTGFRFGGGFYAGNHYRLRNALFQAIGQWGNVRYIHPANDCIIDNVEIRGVAVPTTNVMTLFNPEKANANPVTGTQYIDSLLSQPKFHQIYSPLPALPAQLFRGLLLTAIKRQSVITSLIARMGMLFIFQRAQRWFAQRMD